MSADSQSPPWNETGIFSGPASGSCLVVVLRRRLTLARTHFRPTGRLVVVDKSFVDVAHCDSTGFYDWLRDVNSSLLGVRYWPFEDTEFLIGVAEGLVYTSTKPKHFLEIYFSKNRNFKDTLSCDQDFLHNPVFKANDGEYAVAFGMEQLTEENLGELDRVDAHWLKIETG